MEISLSNLDWEVKGYWPYVPLKEKSMETGQTLHGVPPWIPAQVPGGVHQDLFRAGLIEDPYYGLNSLKCEWVENRWWMYRAAFPKKMEGRDLAKERVSLLFKGMDYEAVVFLNDERLGCHRGMYEPLELDITGKIGEENQLLVLFQGVPGEMGQIGYTSRTSTQKSRFNYKWDFSTHLVNIGLWQEAVLKIREEAELTDCHVSSGYTLTDSSFCLPAREGNHSGVPSGYGGVSGSFEKNSKDAVQIKKLGKGRTMSGSGGSVEIVREWVVEESSVSGEIEVENPRLWFPNGCGEQPLYRVEAQLLEAGRVVSEKCWEQGIRSFALAHNESEHEGALPYTFVVNGRKIYIKGVNLMPLDHLYGNVKFGQYAWLKKGGTI